MEILGDILDGIGNFLLLFRREVTVCLRLQYQKQNGIKVPYAFQMHRSGFQIALVFQFLKLLQYFIAVLNGEGYRLGVVGVAFKFNHATAPRFCAVPIVVASLGKEYEVCRIR